jgi:hypothetical protein
MSVALENGLSVAALHNHFLFDHPKVSFMHIEGEGSVDQLADAVRKIYDTTKAIRGPNAKPGDPFVVAGEPPSVCVFGAQTRKGTWPWCQQFGSPIGSRRCAEIWVTPSFRRRAQRWLCCRRESELFWALSVSGP